MDISSTARSSQVFPSATSSAVEGINAQQQRLDRNVEQIAQGQSADAGFNSQNRALVEQQQIVTAVQANARSLEAANERLGTLIDIEA